MTRMTCKKCGTANNTSDMGYCWRCKAPLHLKPKNKPAANHPWKLDKLGKEDRSSAAHRKAIAAVKRRQKELNGHPFSWRMGQDLRAHAIKSCDPNATAWVAECGKLITGPEDSRQARCQKCQEKELGR